MGRPSLDLTNQRFGWLTVTSKSHIEKKTKTTVHWWNCVCDCGNTKLVNTSNLRSGFTTSCGCKYKQPKSHGMTCGKDLPDEYNIWRGIKQRCRDKNHISYSYYGGIGINICEEWFKSFEAFYNDMGPRPSKKHTIERIDSSKNYTKENCEWATVVKQNRNRASVLYNPESVREARKLYDAGYTTSDISKILNKTYAATYAVVNNISWKDII